MRKYSLVLFSILLISCWHQQWEDRVANGDTGSVAHSQNEIPDTTFPKKVTFYPETKGESLLKQKCYSCHCVSLKSDCSNLKYVSARAPSRDWLYGFIQNADSVIKSGDGYANKIYQEYNKAKHPGFPELTKEEIDNILDYCDVISDPKITD